MSFSLIVLILVHFKIEETASKIIPSLNCKKAKNIIKIETLMINVYRCLLADSCLRPSLVWYYSVPQRNGTTNHNNYIISNTNQIVT